MSEDRRRGEVISFPSVANRPRRTVTLDVSGATVLLFTGVRYARADEAVVMPPVPPSGGEPAGDRRIGG